MKNNFNFNNKIKILVKYKFVLKKNLQKTHLLKKFQIKLPKIVGQVQKQSKIVQVENQ